MLSLVLRTLLLLLVTAVPAFSQAIVTANYTARVIMGGSNPAATADFLTTFSLAVRAGAEGPEVPFTGAFSFAFPQENQIVGSGAQQKNGLYSLSSFHINGIPLGAGFVRLLLAQESGSVQHRDSYIVLITNAQIPSSDGTLRLLTLQLEVQVPGGTLASSLPLGLDFYDDGVNFRGIPDFSYTVQTSPLTFATMTGDTIWDLASIRPFCGEGSPDTDEDGIFDCWETDGIDVNSDGIVDFAPRSDPLQRDIFIEIDWLHGHMPPANTIQRVKRVLANAPFSRGINLRVYLSDDISHIGNDVVFFGPAHERGGAPAGASDFDVLKQAYFGDASDRINNSNRTWILEAKRRIFHYAIFGHQLHLPGRTGVAEILGNDLFIAGGALDPTLLGLVSLRHYTGTPKQLAGILLHELGHNLGLLHGGDDHTQCKPNYVSVMNYSRMVEASPIRGLLLDYSFVELRELTESSLHEPDGISAGTTASQQMWLSARKIAFGPPVITTFNGGQIWETVLFDWADGAIDWNNDGDKIDYQQSFNINELGHASPDCDGLNVNGAPIPFPTGQPFLTGFEDWFNMVFKFQLFPDFADDADVRTLYRWSFDDDGDGISSIFDNCPYDENASQEDGDGDGAGDVCASPIFGDLNDDRVVNEDDLRILRASVGSQDDPLIRNPDADLNGDANVDLLDIAILKEHCTQGCGATVDITPPSIECVAADGLWHQDNLSFRCSAHDVDSGLAQQADTSFELVTSVPIGAEQSDAHTDSRQVCDTRGNCALAGPILGNKIDRSAPTIEPPSNQVAVQSLPAGAPVGYTAPSAHDAGSGLASSGCLPASGSTFAVGTSTVTCIATDQVGNASSSTFTVTVTPSRLVGDLDTNFRVDCADLTYFRTLFGSRKGDARYRAEADFNADSLIDARDLQIISRAMPAGTVCK